MRATNRRNRRSSLRRADVLLLCGDLTEYGLPDEAEALVADIRAAVRIPMVAVLGNHDFESGHPQAAVQSPR